MTESDEPTAIVARVVVDVTGLDKRFDYLVPAALALDTRVGSMVRVPLGARRVGGWVVALGPPDDAVPLDRLKPITKVRGWGPPPEIVDLAHWVAWRWSGRLRSVLGAASPPRAVKRLPAPLMSRPPAARPDPTSVEGGALAAHIATVRLAPTDDELPAVLAAVEAGPSIVIVPSLHARTVLAGRLRTSGLHVAVLPEQWAQAAAGADVVVGTRPAVLAPCPGLRAIVVVDEHDEAMQEERNPTWHARDVAAERARRAGVAVTLISPCPTVSAIAASRTHRRPSRSSERAGWPILDVVDISDVEPWATSLLSSRLITQLRDAQRRVVCVLNTQGRSRRLACRSCRDLTVCDRCEAAVVQPAVGMLVCPRCGERRPTVCQRCGSGAFVNLRPGVARIREELEAAAGRPVVEVTGILEDEPDDAGVYVGTEAVLHRVRRADTVAFLDFDAELLAPRYRAAEQALALLVRGARLAGPRGEGGRLLVQTRFAHHDVLTSALLADPGRLADREAVRRRELGFPPFAALAEVSGAGSEDFVRDGGFSAAPLDEDRWLVRAASWEALAERLAATPRPANSRVRVAVDPPRS